MTLRAAHDSDAFLHHADVFREAAAVVQLNVHILCSYLPRLALPCSVNYKGRRLVTRGALHAMGHGHFRGCFVYVMDEMNLKAFS